MQDHLGQRRGAEGVGDLIPLQERLKVVEPDVPNQRPGGLHNAAGVALIGQSKGASLRGQGVGLAAAVAGTQPEDLGVLVVHEGQLAGVQIGADAFENVARLLLSRWLRRRRGAVLIRSARAGARPSEVKAQKLGLGLQGLYGSLQIVLTAGSLLILHKASDRSGQPFGALDF